MSNVLLAVGNAGSPTSGDTALENRLTSTLGHTVTRISTSDILSNLDGQDILVITASGSSSGFPDISGVTIPIWNAERFIDQDFGWATSEAFLDNDTDGEYLEISNNHHPITATTPLGLARIFTSPPSFAYLYSTIGGDGRAIGLVPGSAETLDRHFLATYDTGDTLSGGGTANNKICLFGLWDNAPSLLSTVGWELFDRSIGWLLGTLSSSSPQLVGSSTASASAGPYSASDYWTGSDSPELAPNDTLVLLFELDAVNTTEDLWGNSSASSGWIIGTEAQSTTYGEAYSVVRVTLPGGSGDLTFTDARLQKGLNCVAVSRLSGGNVAVSVNGGRRFTSSASYVAPSGATHYLGRSHAGNEAVSARIIHAAVIAADSTEIETKKLSNAVHELDNGRLNDEVTGHASLVWDVHFGDDWDGVASTAASSGGSGANTFTATGTIGQTAIRAQDVYSYPASALADTETPSQASGHYDCDSWAALSLTTDSTTLDWSGRHTSTGAYAHVYDVGLDVDGSYSASVYASSPRNVYVELGRVGFSGLAGSNKTLTVYPGTHKDNSGAVEGLFHAGQFRVDSGAAVSLISPSAPSNRLVVVGDSIVSGIDAVPASQHCFATQLRRSNSVDWAITFDSARGRALHSFSGDLTGLGNAIAARCDGTSQNVVLWELGTNDYGEDQSASSYQTNLETVLDAINAADDSITVLLLTLLERDEEGVANGAGDTPADFRTAQSNVQSARSSWVTLIDGPASVTHPTNFHSDGLHPNNDGHDELQTAVESALPAPATALTADDLTAGAPALDSPALGQTHEITAAELTSGASTLDAPTIGQTHELGATDLTAGAGTLGSPELGQNHQLSATELTSGQPTTESPEIGQSHSLTAAELDSGAAALDSPAIGQTHELTAAEVTAGAPVLESPSLSGDHALTASDLTAGAPTVDSPTLGQAHELQADELTSGAPTLDAPALTSGGLTANSLLAGAPVLDAPALGQTHALTAADLLFGVPLFDTPALNAAAAALPPGTATIAMSPLGTATVSMPTGTCEIS